MATQELSTPPPVGTNHDAPGENPALWVEMSRQTRDPRAALDFAQRAVDLNPDNPNTLATLQEIVMRFLRRDAFILFLAETLNTYVVTLRNSRPIVVPKARAQPEIFPPARQTEGERLLGKLWWVTAGLVPAGVGAVLLAPTLILAAFQMLTRPNLEPREKRRAWLAFALASVLGLLGAVFTFVLILHITG